MSSDVMQFAPDAMTARVQAIAQGLAVPGLVFKMTSGRLREHCQDRAAYHGRRAGDKEAEIPEMEKAIESMRESIEKIKGFAQEAAPASAAQRNYAKSASTGYGFQGSDQVAGLEEQIEKLKMDVKEHRNKAAAFAFMAESFFDSTYALTYDDLARLEAVPNR
jgi:hypothetical protein